MNKFKIDVILEVLEIIRVTETNKLNFNVIKDKRKTKEVKIYLNFVEVTELIGKVVDIELTEDGTLIIEGEYPELKTILKFNQLEMEIVPDSVSKDYLLDTKGFHVCPVFN